MLGDDHAYGRPFSGDTFDSNRSAELDDSVVNGVKADAPSGYVRRLVFGGESGCPFDRHQGIEARDASLSQGFFHGFLEILDEFRVGKFEGFFDIPLGP